MSTTKAPLERVIVKKVLEALRSRGAFVSKTHGSPVVTRGLPDIIGVYKGQYIAFEVKRDSTGKPTVLQLYQIEQIRKAGGIAMVIWSVPQAVDVLNEIDETPYFP